MPLRRRPAPSDYLVAGLALALALLGGISSPEQIGPAAIALTIAQTAPLIYRRIVPGPVLGAIATSTAAYVVIGAPFVTTAFLGLTIALYTIASYGNDRSSRTGLVATAAAVAGVFAFDAALGRDVNVLDAFVHLCLVGVAWILGDRARTRRAFTRSLEERADQAERTRAMEAASAAAAERTRIARELHDVVAHSVSTMVLHASAAQQVLDTDAAAARSSLDLIEETGRGAMRELRTILQALRTDEDAAPEKELRPQPGIATLGELARRVGAAGVEIDVRIEGAMRPIPSSVDLSAYRIVQEALTNTTKHSGSRRAEVVVRFSDDHLVLHITDDGRGGAVTGQGFGLAGMRERVELLGGDMHADNRSKGGFEVMVTLPLTGDER